MKTSLISGEHTEYNLRQERWASYSTKVANDWEGGKSKSHPDHLYMLAPLCSLSLQCQQSVLPLSAWSICVSDNRQVGRGSGDKLSWFAGIWVSIVNFNLTVNYQKILYCVTFFKIILTTTFTHRMHIWTNSWLSLAYLITQLKTYAPG